MMGSLPSGLLLAVAGLFIGSFLGTLVLRLPEGKSVVAGRSACPRCGRRLGAFELIPILSWSIQGGRCRGCREPISRFYPGMELAAALIALWASLTTSGVTLLFSCVLGWLLLALAVMDVRTFRLSDALTFPMLALGIVATATIAWPNILDHALGAVLGFAILYLIASAYQALRGREGLGMGDAKLLAAGGAWVGWQGLAPSLLVAGVAALVAVFGAMRLGRNIEPTTRIPFGAFLAFGIWIVWLYLPAGLFLAS